MCCWPTFCAAVLAAISLSLLVSVLVLLAVVCSCVGGRYSSLLLDMLL
jgi:hypothetical protein